MKRNQVNEQEKERLATAFGLIRDASWLGGRRYIADIANALHQQDVMDIVLFSAMPTDDPDIEEYAIQIQADGIIRYHAPRRGTIPWALNGVCMRFASTEWAASRYLRRFGVKALFGHMITQRYSGIATMSWLPDFQHIHFPELFDQEEHLERDRAFLRSARVATRIIVMSDSVRLDFESFAPDFANKVRVLRPVSTIPVSIYGADLKTVLNPYRLPEKFFYLPNQFWKHKNHELVFRSLKNLNSRGVRPIVVCTGSLSDYRHPDYSADLFRKLSDWGISDQVIYLGVVPHEHVLLLIRQSICVINPSLFEGGGYSIDEARSVGKRVLLSDIAPHREQSPPRAIYFDPLDGEEFTGKLEQIWNEAEPGPDIELEAEARRQLPERLRTCGEAFTSITQEAVKDA